MTEQTKAQRLADEFDNGNPIAHTNQWKEEASAELRRLDALNAELVGALGFIVGAYRDTVSGKTSFYMPGALRKAEAALAKAKEQT